MVYLSDSKFNPTALGKTKFAYNFGLSECTGYLVLLFRVMMEVFHCGKCGERGLHIDSFDRTYQATQYLL